MNRTKIGFVGSGRVTAFMIEGLTGSGGLYEIAVMDANPDASKNLAGKTPGVADRGNRYEAAKDADVLFIALPPANVQAGCESVAPFLGDETIVISLAPKAGISALCGWLGTEKVVRYLPNAATSAGNGYNPVSWGVSLGEKDRDAVRELLSPLGDMPEIDESGIETYAVLSAMGPTYLWPLLDEMIASGIRYGLAEGDSSRLVSRMAVACAKMIEFSGKDYATRMDMIPSKPMADIEPELRSLFRTRLDGIYAKLTS